MKSGVKSFLCAGLLIVVFTAGPDISHAQERLKPGETLWPTTRAQRDLPPPDLVPLRNAPSPPAVRRETDRAPATFPEAVPEAAIEPQAGTQDPVSAPELSETEPPTGVLPEGRQAVISGRITDVDPREITIMHRGREITVRADPLIAGRGSLNHFYEEDMWVTVEGILESEDEITATSIARGDYVDDEDINYGLTGD